MNVKVHHHQLVVVAVAQTKQRGRKATTARVGQIPNSLHFVATKTRMTNAHKAPLHQGHSRAKALGTLAEAGPTDTREHPILLLAATNAQEHPVLSLRRV